METITEKQDFLMENITKNTRFPWDDMENTTKNCFAWDDVEIQTKDTGIAWDDMENNTKIVSRGLKLNSIQNHGFRVG